MAVPGLGNGARITVGIKQTRLAIDRGKAVKVFIARDADAKLVEPIIAQCSDKEIPLVSVASMRELGKACGIQVGAAAAALID
jgi:large subunit ribosomal protein L7A